MGDGVDTATAHPAEAGWDALARAAWDEALRWFTAAARDDTSPSTLEGLAWAAWWRGDPDVLFDARERAFRSYREAGLDRDAARCAMWLGTDSVDFRGEVAIARGWLRRARSLLGEDDGSVEDGWLRVHEAEKLLLLAGEAEQARRLGAEAAERGREFGELDLEILGSATEGLALVYLGQVEGRHHPAR